jgi:HEAT repeat protein
MYIVSSMIFSSLAFSAQQQAVGVAPPAHHTLPAVVGAGPRGMPPIPDFIGRSEATPAQILGIPDLLDADGDGQDDPGYATYKSGYDLILQEKWAEARKKFAEMISKYPKSKYVDDAEYWWAYSWKYSEVKKAIESYKRFLKQYPNSNYYDDAVVDLSRLETPSPTPALATAPAVVGVPRPGVPTTGIFTPRPPRQERDDELDMKKEALLAIARSSKDKSTFELLKEVALDTNQPREMRETAFYMLREFKGQDATDVYMHVIRSGEDVKIKQNAIYWLGQTGREGEEKVYAMIKEIALDPKQERETREAAMHSLREMRKGEVIDVFVQMARSDPDNRIRQTALYYIGQSARADEGRAYQILRGYALDQNQDRSLRESAFHALQELKRSGAFELFVDIAKKDPDERIRGTALYYIGEAGKNDPEKVLNIYKEFLMDQTQPRKVRESVIYSLSNLRHDSVLDLLIQTAKSDPDERIQENAIYYIGQLGKKKAKSIEVLTKLFDEIPKDRTKSLENVLYAVASIGTDQSVEFLGKVAKTHEDMKLRRTAVYYLGSIGGERARAVLYDILKGK